MKAGRGQSPAKSPTKKLPSRLPRAAPPQKRDNSSGSSSDSYRRGSRGNSPGAPRSRGSDDSIYEQSLNGSQASLDPFSPEDNINVVVRVRPLNDKELRRNDPSVISFPGNGQILLDGLSSVVGHTGSKQKLFSYNVVFEPGATQEDVFQFSGVKRLVEMAVEGFSTTVFCYGQTGSGKTHTLTGPPGLVEKNADPFSPNHGLVFRGFLYLFQLLQEMRDTHFVLKASFLEIYNEKVIDLLNPGTVRKPLAVRWSKKSGGFFVENLFTVDCEELDDLLAVLEEGMKNRSVGSHSMNEHSSRSHTILTVNITSEQQMEDNVFITKQGKINFVDLAGSEMTKKTHSEGKTLEEANNINKSLMVLGYCISSLSDSKKKNGHIPYRDSKLTKLLADSLAGNGVTLMVACVSPARSNVTETLNTLRYAARAKKIRTKPIVVMFAPVYPRSSGPRLPQIPKTSDNEEDPREALIMSLKREVGALQEENEHLRTALHLSAEYVADSSREHKLQLKTPPNFDLEKVASMEGSELAELVRHYAKENEALRKENSELFSVRDLLVRDQEIVCRENERLLKKLEDVNSVCCRSPLIPARPSYSGDLLNSTADLDNSNLWTNPLHGSLNNINNSAKLKDQMNGKVVKPPHRLPDSIQKELDKRQIGKSLAESIRDRNLRKTTSDKNASGNGNRPIGSASSGPVAKSPSLDNIHTHDTNLTQRSYDTNLTQRAMSHNSLHKPSPSPGSKMSSPGSGRPLARPTNSGNTQILSLRNKTSKPTQPESSSDRGKSLRDPFGSLLSLHEEEVAAAV